MIGILIKVAIIIGMLLIGFVLGSHVEHNKKLETLRKFKNRDKEN